MERIKQMTDTQRYACLWVATAIFAIMLLFLFSGKVYARSEVSDIFDSYTEERNIYEGKYLGWQDGENHSMIVYGMWKENKNSDFNYVALTVANYDDPNPTVSKYEILNDSDLKVSTEFYIPHYSDGDSGTWLYDTICTTELNGEQRVILPCYEEVHCRLSMTYKGKEVIITGTSGVTITSSDNEIASAFDSSQDDEISCISGYKAGTVSLTCNVKASDGDVIFTQTLPCDVVNIEIGREKARYEGYGICVLPDTDVTLLAKTDGLEAYKNVSYEWNSDTFTEINNKKTQSVTFKTPETETEAEISVDIYINNQKFTTASAYLKVQNCDLDFTIYERTTTSLKKQDTTTLNLNKQYLFTLKNGEFGWDCGNNEDTSFYAWNFTMNGETFTADSKVSEDYETPIQQPSFMTYGRGIAGDNTPNCTILLKKSGTLTITAMIYQNNKPFREVVKTFNVQSDTTGTPQTPLQTNPTPKQDNSLKQGTKITDKKSKAVYKVNGNKTVEYNKANKKAKNVTIPSTVTLNGTNYQVTSIAAKSFANNKNLKKVVIPATVKNIGKQAFSGCKNLKNITIKTTYLTKKSVGAKAFKGIHAKATIKVPKKQKKAYQKFLKAKGIGKNMKIK